jgi:hypothetical protein
MPSYPQPGDQWLVQQINQLKRDVAALKAQTTQYVTDSSGSAQAIIGQLAQDQAGTSTGLSGVGIATWNGAAWSKVHPGQPARARRNSALTVNGTTKIPVDTVDFDPGGNFDVTTNHRYNVPATGYYHVDGALLTNSPADLQLWVDKNGALELQGTLATTSTANDCGGVVGGIVKCSAGDYLELFAWTSASVTIATGVVGRHYLSVIQVA